MAWNDIDLKGAAGWGAGRALQAALVKVAQNMGFLKPMVRSSAAANYTLALDDRHVRATKADGAQTVTVPTNATVAFDIGTRIRIEAATAQTVTIAPVSGTVTIRKLATKSLAIVGQYGVVTLEKVAVNEWVATGDFAAV